MDIEDFEKKLDEFFQLTPDKSSGKYFILETNARNRKFRLFKNSMNSFIIKPLDGQETEMQISKQHILDVAFREKRPHYSSYVPILIDLIRNGTYINLKEVKEDDIDLKRKAIETRMHEYDEGKIPVPKNVKHYFSIKGSARRYPRKEILKGIEKEIGLEEGFKTDEAKRVLERIFGDDIHFIDISISEVEKGNAVRNIILYGPPGTGKTVNYRRMVDMIESGKSIKSVFENIKDNNFLEDNFSHYKTAEAEGRVQFVTFHQNFSYEDFIEGYRPDKSAQIMISDGVFKNLCNGNPDCYLSVGEKYGKYEIVSISDEIIRIKKDNGYVVPVPLCTYRRLLKGVLSGGIKLEDLKEGREAELPSKLDDCNDPYIVNGYGSIWYQLCSAAIKKINTTNKDDRTKNKYLIIDEINRGNISKIFGELITLIEEDKRGKLTVTLPYSKEPFTVPGNLYIIATMNSTDKSIALIDVALRRRFTFVKMMPNPELVENGEAKTIMAELNRFITEKLGEDFQIGHSYFMTDDLDFAIDYKIVPLLEEYFFADVDSLKEAKSIVGKGEA